MYGSGSVSGFFSVDEVTLADDLIVKDQRFAEVQDAGGLGLAYTLGKFDGILGLGFTSISIDNTPTVFENAMKQNVVDQPVFSFYLGDNKPGELTFGGYDPTKFEGDDLTYVKLLSATYWEIGLDTVTAGDYHASPNADGSPITAIVDSGTSLMVGPKKDITQLASAVGAKANFMGQYTIDCDKVEEIPDVVFTIDGNDYTVPGKNTVIKAQGTCLFAFMGMGKCLVWCGRETYERDRRSLFNSNSCLACRFPQAWTAMDFGRRLYAPGKKVTFWWRVKPRLAAQFSRRASASSLAVLYRLQLLGPDDRFCQGRSLNTQW